jgi:hypothetical protein
LIMRALALFFLMPLLSGAADAQPPDTSGIITILNGKDRKTVFLSELALEPPTTLRICYVEALSDPAPDSVMVVLGSPYDTAGNSRWQKLGPGECSFFSGPEVFVSISRGAGTARVGTNIIK